MDIQIGLNKNELLEKITKKPIALLECQCGIGYTYWIDELSKKYSDQILLIEKDKWIDYKKFDRNIIPIISKLNINNCIENSYINTILLIDVEYEFPQYFPPIIHNWIENNKKILEIESDYKKWNVDFYRKHIKPNNLIPFIPILLGYYQNKKKKNTYNEYKFKAIPLPESIWKNIYKASNSQRKYNNLLSFCYPNIKRFVAECQETGNIKKKYQGNFEDPEYFYDLFTNECIKDLDESEINLHKFPLSFVFAAVKNIKNNIDPIEYVKYLKILDEYWNCIIDGHDYLAIHLYEDIFKQLFIVHKIGNKTTFIKHVKKANILIKSLILKEKEEEENEINIE